MGRSHKGMTFLCLIFGRNWRSAWERTWYRMSLLLNKVSGALQAAAVWACWAPANSLRTCATPWTKLLRKADAQDVPALIRSCIFAGNFPRQAVCYWRACRLTHRAIKRKLSLSDKSVPIGDRPYFYMRLKRPLMTTKREKTAVAISLALKIDHT